jgi:hypothetical protein
MAVERISQLSTLKVNSFIVIHGTVLMCVMNKVAVANIQSAAISILLSET